MVLIRSLSELMEDQILQYYKIVLNINDRAYIYIETHTHTHTHTYIYIYIYIYIYYMVVSLTLGFML